ncbi:MAG: Gfo/Idh/MocA family oxidoreductase [Bryobacterales bacterium]|nr:Gfo/Idh/MocA family oxidoreductase [Bryobacterales bacterium]
MERRSFLAMMLAAPRRWRVAIIGHTGRGNYGHNLDIAFQGVANVDIVAVADPVEAGRSKAMARSSAAKGYADYREMLRAEKPDVVVIGPRWLDQRVAMVRAAAETGAHLLMEKAFAATLEDGDAMMLSIGNRKVQVCHTARLAPATIEGVRMIREGAIGEVLELRARGKEDHRAGGEDMLTLGTHCLDLMRMIAGSPVRCSAMVLGPKKQPTEPVGPVAGDAIHATFEFQEGLMGTFDSQKNSGPHSHRYGVTVYGSTGAIAFPINDIPNGAWIVRSPSWRGNWEPIPAPDASEVTTHPQVNTLFARDLIAAIEQDRATACQAIDGLWTIEMVQAVYASSIAGGPVTLPLKKRRHPLL